MLLKKINGVAIATTLSLALAACGGGGGGGSPSSASVSGAAVKGILKNANVDLFKLEDGTIGAKLAGTTTDASGKYSFSGVSYSGPALIRVSGKPETTMVCDVLPDCDGVAFGEDAPFTSGALEAVTVVVGGTVSVNVTPLTHLAAKKAEAGGFSSSAVSLANSHVANLFGITGSLTALPAVDITKPTTLGAATAEAQKAALLAAALYAAAQAEGQSLDQLAHQFVSDNGQFVGSETTETGKIDLAEVYDQAKSVLAQSAYSGLTAITSQINTALASALTQGNTLTTAAPSGTADASNLAKTKAFVSQLRNLGTSFISDQSYENFANEVNAAKALLSTDTEHATTVLAYVVEAIADAESARQEGGATSPYLAEFDERTVTVTFTNGSNGQANYSVTQISGFDGSPTVNVQAAFKWVSTLSEHESATESGWTYKSDSSDDIVLSIKGSVTVSTTKIELMDGSKVVGNARGQDAQQGQSSETETSYSDSWKRDELFTADADFDLRAKLTGIGAAAGNSLQGNLTFKVADLSIADSDEEVYAANWGSENYTYSGSAEEKSITKLNTASIGFSGKVQTPSNTLDIIFSFQSNGKNIAITETRSVSWSNDGYSSMYNGIKPDEIASGWIEGSFALETNATLAGITGQSKLKLTGSRTDLRKGKINAEISYGTGNILRIDANDIQWSESNVVLPPAVTITNQDGVKATLTLGDQITGRIHVGNEQYATITEPNVIKVTYADGTFESIQ